MWNGTMMVTLLAAVLSLTSRAGDINEELWQAARKGDAAAVKSLLERGAEVNAKFNCGTTALFQAAWKGHVEVVKVLLEHGADVNVIETCYKSSMMGFVGWNGNAEIAKLLLDKGAKAGDEALLGGAQAGHIEVVRAVLERGGANKESLSEALRVATLGKRTEIVELLKKAGATPPPDPDFAVDAQTLQTYAGVYANPDGTEWTLTLKEGKLTGGPTGEPEMILGAFDKVTFRPRDQVNPTITFQVEGGRVVGLTLKSRTETTVLKKLGGKR